MIRVGIGYDSHRFAPGRPFILGAAAAGDMGAMFPDSDPQWKDADSLMLLRLARERISQLGFRPVQADVTVICEKPHLGVYKEAMAAAIADELGIPADAVGMKAKTNEGMGFVGRGEGVAVFAVALVEDR